MRRHRWNWSKRGNSATCAKCGAKAQPRTGPRGGQKLVYKSKDATKFGRELVACKPQWSQEARRAAEARMRAYWEERRRLALANRI